MSEQPSFRFCFAFAVILFAIGTVGSQAAGLLAADDEKPTTQSFLAGSDWPMYRHDPALSADSPLRGSLAEEPQVAWSLDLGGPHVPQESIVVRDVTGDGLDEFLTLSADSVACRDNRGRLHWRLEDFLNPTVGDILDFAGDGSRGILVTSTRAGKVDTYMVNGRSILVDLDGDGRPEILVAVEDGKLYCLKGK